MTTYSLAQSSKYSQPPLKGEDELAVSGFTGATGSESSSAPLSGGSSFGDLSGELGAGSKSILEAPEGCGDGTATAVPGITSCLPDFSVGGTSTRASRKDFSTRASRSTVDRVSLSKPVGEASPCLLSDSSPLLGYTVKTARCECDPISRREVRQRKRAFHRIISGVERARGRKRQLRFITLTSPPGSTPEEMSAHFRALIGRIRRLTPRRLAYKLGYVDKGGQRRPYVSGEKLHYYYPGKGLDDPLDFEYISVQTAEGNGVNHILYVGDYLPQAWLSHTWGELHGAWNVDIRKAYGEKSRIAGYLARYCTGQNHFIRYSCSWGWVWKGFVSDWKHLKYLWRCAINGRGAFAFPPQVIPYSSLLAQWHWHLMLGPPP